ncbi:MAG: D-aminoacyl-tRNA deacylase, partial [Betaproteobacteria bacterium]
KTFFPRNVNHNKRTSMILLVSSNKDVASQNIKEQLLARYSFQKSAESFQDNPLFSAEINGKSVTIATLSQESVLAQTMPEDFPNAELIVFISRHSSQSGKPTLSVHAPGNFAEAELGGLPKKVSIAPAVAMQTALKALVHYQNPLLLHYEVSYECTHHGPSLNVPTMFVELGSSEAQWNDNQAAQVVADATMTAIVEFRPPTECAVLGIGGTHYNQKFTLMALMGEAIFGHMIPKYALANIDAQTLKECLNKTLEKVTLAVLDWKGIRSEDKPNLLSALETLGLPYKKV